MFIHYGDMKPKEGFYTVEEYKKVHSNKQYDDIYNGEIQYHIDMHCPPKDVKGIYCFPMFRYSIDYTYIYAYITESIDVELKWKVKRGEYINEFYHEVKENQIKNIYSKIEKDGSFNNTWKKYDNIIDYLEALFNRIDMHIKEYVKDTDNYIERIDVCKYCNDSNALEVFIELKEGDKD